MIVETAFAQGGGLCGAETGGSGSGVGLATIVGATLTGGFDGDIFQAIKPPHRQTIVRQAPKTR